MRRVAALAVLLPSLALVSACGGSSQSDDGGSGGATGGHSGTGGASGGTGGASGGTGGAAGSGGGTSNLGVEIVSTQLGVDCMPMVGTDPINGTFDVKYDNSAGSTPDQATITSATAHISKNGTTLDWTFAVTPTSSGFVFAGATGTVTHTKTPGSGSGTGLPCDFCGGELTLGIEYTTSSGSGSASSAPSSVMCAL
jgi:hypothetical protein